MRVFAVLLLLAPLQGSPKWKVLEPTAMVSAGKATLTRLEDHSILASGENPDRDTFTITVRNDLKGVTAFKIEALADPSLGASGPGRAAHGNFVLSEIRVEAGGKPVTLVNPVSDYDQPGWTAEHTLDMRADTGWAVDPRYGKNHEIVFEVRPALTAESVTFVLDFQSPHGKHAIGRVRISATSDKSVAKVSPGDLPEEIQAILEVPPPRRTPLQKDALADHFGKRADAAVKKGVEWLKQQAEYPGSHAGGSQKLVLWTFVHAGVPENDPRFQELLRGMLAAPLERTYRVALQAMILEELERVKYQPRIAQCAQFLVDNQAKNGQWHYGEPTEFVKSIPVDEKKEVQTGKVREFAPPSGERRKKPKVEKHIAVKKNKEGPGGGDNSNSQYAALGLRACWEAGVMIPRDVIQRARAWWIESQHPDPDKDNGYGGVRGWGYAGKDAPPPYGSMTAGAVGSLVILDHMLDLKGERNPAVKSGMNWLASHFTVTGNPQANAEWQYYYLYGLERAGVLSSTEKLGRHEWYPAGARMLFAAQAPEGPWGSVWNTCFAILFLKRATRPLDDVATEDPYYRKRKP